MVSTGEQLKDWLKTIEVRGGRVLDCGGSQNPLSRERLKVFEPDEYKILDLEEPHLRKQDPDIIVDLNKRYVNEDGDFELPEYFKYFDVAFCLEVFEYIFRPYEALETINRFLKPNGLFYSSWHFLYPVHGPTNQDFMRYTRWGIEKLMKESGFGIEEIKPRTICGVEMIGFYKKQGMRPAKTYNGHSEVGHMVKARKQK